MTEANILVVDDEGITAMELQQKLKFWGYEVPTFAFSRKEAVKKAKKIKPDLILMDIVLKGEGDGIDAVTEIKNIFDVPIIYLTAYSDKQTMQRANITEPYDYIIKPFDDNELHESIERALYKHKIEKTLKEAGEWLDKNLKESGGAVIVTNKEGQIKFINQNAQLITGFTKEEAYIRDLSEVFNIRIGNLMLDNKESEDGNITFNNMKTESTGSEFVKDIINEGVVTDIKDEYYLSDKNGKIIPIDYNASPIKNDDGEFLGIKLVFNDISEILNEKKSLLESEKRFKKVYSQSPVGIGMYNSEGQIIEANSSALELFGVETVSKLKDLNLFQDFKLSNKENEMLLDGKTVKYETEFDFKGFEPYNTTKSGLVYLEIIFKPMIFVENSTKNSYLVYFHDITKHRDTEEFLKNRNDMYQGLIGSIGYPFIALDSDLNCKYSNKESEKITGISTDKTLGKSLWELLPDFKNPKDLEDILRKSIEAKKSEITVFEYLQDNNKEFLELNINPLDDGLSIILRDVTTIISREDETKRLEKLYRIIENLTEPVCRFDPNGTLTYANKSYKKYFASGVVGSSFVFSVPVEEQEKIRNYISSFNEANPIKILESPIKMPNGDIEWWRWVTKALFDEGNIKELQSVGHEITEQRNREAELNSNINWLETEIKEKTEYFESTNKSLEAALTERNREKAVLEDLSKKLENMVNETSSELSKTKKILETSIVEHKIAEESLNYTIEKLEKELDETRSEFDKTVRKLQNELKKSMKAEEDINEKYQVLEVQFNDVSREFSSTKTDMESEIKKQVEAKESIIKMKDELQNQLETKKSTLIKLNNDLNTEIAKRVQIENLFNETQEKLKKELNEKQDKHNKAVKKMESEIAEHQMKYNESCKLIKEKDMLLKDVQFRAKKNMQRISSLTGLQSDYIRDQIDKRFRDSQNHIKSIALIHEKLYESTDIERINLADYVKSLVDDLFKSLSVDTNRISMNVQVENVFLDIDTATSCGLIINELVSNSIKHAFPGGNEGTVRIEIFNGNNDVEMIIKDDGIGLSDRVNFDKPDTLGLQLVKTLVAEINGKIELINDTGTNLMIKFNNNGNFE